MSQLTLVIGQLNFLVGDIAGNKDKILRACQHAKQQHQADIIIFPELALTGYSPEDLLLRKDFIYQAELALIDLQKNIHDIYAIVGHPYATPRGLFNSATVLHNGNVICRYHKQILPNYGVFDEQRYFIADDQPTIFTVKGTKLGILICEDLWQTTPAQQACLAGAEIILSLHASPFDHKKISQREQTLQARIKEIKRPIVYVNLIGGQDELVFDGGSMALDASGNIQAQADYFKEQLLAITFNQQNLVKTHRCPPHHHWPLLYQALVLGTRDYAHKNGFTDAVLGLSGGIDSALTLAIAVDALGAKHVHAVMLPSRYTSQLSFTGAQQQIDALGIKASTISIEPMFSSFLRELTEEFTGYQPDTTEENI
ncbi:MAG: NAD+ synthase, partial [Gammaproteobacteria bacterium]|nr:NAD+ synthase [Gammaproteobacteria bacterium]